MVIDEITAVAALLLVEVCLGNSFVGEEVVCAREFKDELETRLVKIFHSDVSQVFESSFITLGNQICKRRVVLHGRKPKFWDSLDGRIALIR